MFEKETDAVVLSASLSSFVSEWKSKPGNLIMILHKVQEEFGYIPREVALELSRRLDVPLAKIYGVITFYHFFKLSKPGKHKVQVCMGTACYLKGGEDLLRNFEQLLSLPVNSSTEDGEFSLEAVRCIGCCGLAPVMTIDGEVFGKVTADQLPDIIAKFKGV